MNKWIGMGRITKSLELKRTSEKNIPVCNFTLAVDRRFKKGESKTADFINCVAWDKTAEFVDKHFGKGSMLAVVGRLQTRTWEDREGVKQYVTEVIVEEAYFTGEKRDVQKKESANVNVNDGKSGEGPQFSPDEDDDLPF